MNTHSLFRWTIAVSLLLFGAPAANAACVIGGVRPSYVPLPTMRLGQDFLFVATAGCQDLLFSVPGTTFSKIPKAGPDEGSKDRTYKVNLTRSEWHSLIGASQRTFVWSITGETSAGVTTQVTTTNDLDVDIDYWTRREGDVGACDHDRSIHPGLPEICDGIDQDCDGLIDDNTGPWFRDADGDGYGDDGDRRCDWAEGYVDVGTDCDDTDSALWCPTLDLSLADAKLVGERSPGWGWAGYSVSGAGDVDGDGQDDLLVGAYGAAYLVQGPVTGTLDLALADAKLVGEHRLDAAGNSVSGAGDVDADGHDDLLIGAMGNQYRRSGAGAAYVVLGPVTGTLDLSLADAKLVGERKDDQAGYSVSDAGDVDSDGHDDLLVGAPYNSVGRFRGAASNGAAYLVLGPVTGSLDLSLADAKLVGEESYDWAGMSVSGAGDVDGDGDDDLLVGSYINSESGSGAGAAYLVLGPATGTLDLSLADAKLVGDRRGYPGDYAGYSVSGAGDVDGDGRDDVLVGAVWHSERGSSGVGAAYLVLGPVTGHFDLVLADAKLVGEEAYDLAGISVSGAGDVDGNGHDDLLIGSKYNDEGGDGAGAAYLVLGPVTGTVDLSFSDVKLVGEEPNDLSGTSVSGAGDVDADGLDDLLIGAYQNAEGGVDAGAAYLIYGGGL